jgi:hypothetical protein
VKRSREYDFHHIVPQSIGGANDEKNMIRVNRQQHQCYHELFNNYHPSTIIRLFFLVILKTVFNIEVHISKEPYLSFLTSFDKIMLTRWNTKNFDYLPEELERTKQIFSFNIQKINQSQSSDNKNLRRKTKFEKFKIRLEEFTTFNNSQRFTPTGLFIQLCYWFKIDKNVYHNVLLELKELEKNILISQSGH